MHSSKNIFIGICSKCGESYEAQTSLEDLEGVTFTCKKMFCDGKVELKYAGLDEIISSSKDKTPRRYC